MILLLVSVHRLVSQAGHYAIYISFQFNSNFIYVTSVRKRSCLMTLEPVKAELVISIDRVIN